MPDQRFRLQYFDKTKWVHEESNLQFPKLTSNPLEAMEFITDDEAASANRQLPPMCVCYVEAFTPSDNEPIPKNTPTLKEAETTKIHS